MKNLDDFRSNDKKATDVTVVVPSLNPDEKLRETVKSLLDVGFHDIILVNDGSAPEYLSNFPTDLPGCTLLTHEVNRGKGAAMKTAFSHYLKTDRVSPGVITVDGDGQHLAKDVLACARLMCETERVVLGVRDFSQPQVPARSRTGNRITSTVFRIFCGLRISDTQTGLRAIPKRYLSDILAVKGNRYEYETNMLLEMGARKIPTVEEKISTVYIEENETSHFRPVRDSFRIYWLICKFIFRRLFVFLKFLISSSLCFLLDLGLFNLFDRLITPILALAGGSVASVCARVISAIVNYILNRKTVFRSNDANKRTLPRYCILAVCILFLSTAAVTAFSYISGIGAKEYSIYKTVFKGSVDTLLFLLSYRIQKQWVFSESKK